MIARTTAMRMSKSGLCKQRVNLCNLCRPPCQENERHDHQCKSNLYRQILQVHFIFTHAPEFHRSHILTDTRIYIHTPIWLRSWSSSQLSSYQIYCTHSPVSGGSFTFLPGPSNAIHVNGWREKNLRVKILFHGVLGLFQDIVNNFFL